MSQQSEWHSLTPGAKCPKCKQERGPDGHDPCIRHLSGVQYACCGHGQKYGGYIYFNSGQCIRMKITDVEYYPALSHEAKS